MNFDEMMNSWLDSDDRWSDFERDESSEKLVKGDLRSFLEESAS